jgi:hypothetical protein
LDRERFNAPVEGLLVGDKEDIDAVAVDCAATVEYFYGLIVVIAGDYHFHTEGVSFISGDEGFAYLDFMARCGYPVCGRAAAFFTGTIGGYTHLDGLPLVGWFGPSEIRTDYLTG